MSELVWTETHQAIFKDVRDGQSASITARAGCGKTCALARATAEVSPSDRILVTAFGKAAQQDLEKRVSKRCHVATSHSLGLKVVKASNEGMSLKVEFDRLDGIIRRVTTSRLAREDYAAVKDTIALAKNTLANSHEAVRQIVTETDPGCKTLSQSDVTDLAWNALEQCKLNDGKLDFDDMIWLPNVWDLHSLEYNVFFVDEAQDTNVAQMGLFERCRADDARFYVVGDPRQSLFSFRGADSQAMSRMATAFTINKEHLLPVSYRCPQAVIKWAQKIVPDIQATPSAPDGLVRECDSYMTATPGDFVISRSNSDLMTAYAKFRKLGVSAAILGGAFASALRALVRKSNATNVPDLLKWLTNYRQTRITVITANEPDLTKRAQLIEKDVDRIDSVEAIATGAPTVNDVHDRIEAAFAKPKSDAVILTTTHQAKGLEADRVWLIADSYAFHRKLFQRRYFFEHGKTADEDLNLAYVATTRAKKELHIVVGTREIPR